MFDPKMTCLQALRKLYRIFREEIGEDSYLLACAEFSRGVAGFADAARIGPDSVSIWEAGHPCCILECIRTIDLNAEANGLLFWNDPDVTYLGSWENSLALSTVKENDRKQKLNADEVQTWHTFVGLLGGLMFTSNPLQKPEVMAEARRLEIICPPTPDRGYSFHAGIDRNHQRFGFIADRPRGSFATVALWNPKEEPADLPLAIDELKALGQDFHAWSFWDNQYLGVIDHNFIAKAVAPHGCVLLRITPVNASHHKPILAGSTLHISLGAAEIQKWISSQDTLKIEFSDAGARDGELVIHSNQPLVLRSFEGITNVSIQSAGISLWRLLLMGRKRGQQQSVRLDVGE